MNFVHPLCAHCVRLSLFLEESHYCEQVITHPVSFCSLGIDFLDPASILPDGQNTGKDFPESVRQQGSELATRAGAVARYPHNSDSANSNGALRGLP